MNRAILSREDTIIAQEKEQIALAWNSLILDKTTGKISEIDEDNFETELNNSGNNTKVDYLDDNPDNDYSVTFKDTTHEYIVDKNGNITLKGNKIIEEDTSKLTADTIEKNGNASDYFGKYVTNYVAKTENGINYNNYNELVTNDAEKWQIFYIGDAGNGKNQIYLISSNYIKYDCMPLSRSRNALNKRSDYQAYFNNILNDYPNGSEDVKEQTRYLNKQYFDYLKDNNTTSTNSNMKKVAYMSDIDIWDVYANEYSEWAMGGTTAELFAKSYNEKYGERHGNMTLTIYSNGYNASGSKQSFSDASFDEYNLYKISSYTQSEGYQMASPYRTTTSLLASYTDFLFEMYYTSINDYHNNVGDKTGFRPLICLNSNVELEQDGSNYKIVEGKGARPTFTTNYEDLQNGTSKITILNINYKENNNINNWQVKYKRSFENSWQTSNDLSFTVNNGIYNVKIVSGNIESKEKKVYVGDYINLEYIESTGTQYIDTGITANGNIGFEIKFSTNNPISSSNYGSIFGARKGSKDNELQLTTYQETSAFLGTVRYKGSSYNAHMAAGQINEISYLNNDYIVNGTEYSISRTTFNSSNSITIFALNNNNTITQYGSNKLYFIKLYSGTELIRDYIPVYDSTTNTAGLYDKVENKFYPNNGTGSFIAGPEKVSD